MLFGKDFLGLGGQWQVVTEPLGKALAGLGSEAFEVITHKCPDAADFVEVAFDANRPAFESGLALPKKFFVAMKMLSIGAVFGGVIAEQPQIKKIGRAREKLEWSKVTFVERSGVGPNPTDTTFLK